MKNNISDLYIGQKASMQKTFNTEDVLTFANISDDKNPIHVNEEYASKSIFGGRIVHGFYVGSLISALIASKLPGEGSIYLHQDMDFKKPVMHGDTITATVEITNIKVEKSIIYLTTQCCNQKGDMVISGNAVIKLS